MKVKLILNKNSGRGQAVSRRMMGRQRVSPGLILSNHVRRIIGLAGFPVLLWILVTGSGETQSTDVDPIGHQVPPVASFGTANGCAQLNAEAPESTFVMLDTVTRNWIGCNIERARVAYLPASTFKVVHALIALETGVVTDPHELAPWDGKERVVPSWNQDTSLALGMTNSTIWFYQGTARQIGAGRMRDWVRRLDYGNGDIGADSDLTTFWLDGPLRISAIEQVVFLDRLRRGTLPLSEETQELVAEMMRQDNGEVSHSSAVIHSKSGAVLPIDPKVGDISDAPVVEARLADYARIGWFVGWVSQASNTAGERVFAFNLDLSVPGALGKREKLTRMMLELNETAR